MTSTPKGMESLNGIRVISMAWIILGHTYRLMTSYTSNVFTVYGNTPKEFTFQFVYQGDLSVDTFFFLSGFLVAFGTLKVLRKSKGKLNWALFYINRYLRLTPVYMFVLFFWITIVVQLISGPYQDREMLDLNLVNKCYSYWWKNIIYMNTILSEVLDMCMLWSWYLANDMIYFLLSPIFIYTLYRKRYLGYVLILLGLLGNSMAIGIIYNKYGLADKAGVQADDTRTEYANDVYFRPAYRIAPYLIGLFMADFFVWTKDKARNMQATWWKVFVVVMWVIAIGMNWTLLFGIYPYNKVGTYITPYWLMDLYASTYRTVWALIVAWISYACMTGWGGFINKLLSMKIWEPMVRLCYLAYLLHPIVMFALFTNLQQTIMGNHWIFAWLFAAHFGITFALSTVIHLFVEQPLGRVQRYFLRK